MNAVELQPGRHLHDLLVLTPDDPGVAEVRRLAALRVGGLDAREARVLGRKVADWSVDALAGDLRGAFEVDPFALLVQAWVQLGKVRQAVRASLGPPAVEKSCAIGRHKIAATLEPHLVLEVQGIDWCDVPLVVELALSFDAVELVFLGGTLTRAGFGRPSGSVTLKCAGQEVASAKREIHLQPSYHFDPPLRLPVTAAGAA